MEIRAITSNSNRIGLAGGTLDLYPLSFFALW